jgi:hypothetical protein
MPPANFTILLNNHASAFPLWSGRLTVPVLMNNLLTAAVLKVFKASESFYYITALRKSYPIIYD